VSRNTLELYRNFLKDSIRKTVDFAATDQSRGVEAPPIEKPFRADARRVDLVKPGKWTTIPACDLTGAIRDRRSRRA
jgi:hypothetical protein